MAKRINKSNIRHYITVTKKEELQQKFYLLCSLHFYLFLRFAAYRYATTAITPISIMKYTGEKGCPAF